MSALPRPRTQPSRSSPQNGSTVHPSPTGTTSVWPSRSRPGPSPPSRTARRLGRPGAMSTTSTEPAFPAGLRQDGGGRGLLAWWVLPGARTTRVSETSSPASIRSRTRRSSSDTTACGSIRPRRPGRPRGPAGARLPRCARGWWWRSRSAAHRGTAGSVEGVAGDEGDALREREREERLRVDGGLEGDPEEEAALRVGPAGAAGEVLLQCPLHRPLAPAVLRPLRRQVRVEVAAGEEAGHEPLHGEVGAGVHRLLGVDQQRLQLGCGVDPADAEAGRDDLGEGPTEKTSGSPSASSCSVGTGLALEAQHAVRVVVDEDRSPTTARAQQPCRRSSERVAPEGFWKVGTV